MKSKILLSIIILSLLISYIFPVISLGNYGNYISLGDSIPYGYALEDLNADNYAEKLRQKLYIPSANFENLSISEETTQQFYTTIQSTKYTNAIKNADLLTITIGSNEILEIVREAAAVVSGIDINEKDFYEKLLIHFKNASLSDKIRMLVDLYKYFTTEDIKGKLDKNIARYEEYWKKSLQYIEDINPNITIVATEFYNPYYEVTLLNYDFGNWVDEIMQRMNNILYKYSESETKYKIAKIYSTFNTTNPRLTNVNLSLSNFNIDPHPTVLGHELISLKILETLSSNNTTATKKDISTLYIKNLENQEYTGNSIEPEIVIKDGNFILVENQDYNVIYTNNVDVGQASAVIVGTGNYTGQIVKTFNIQNSNVKDISTCKVNALEYQVYLGVNLEPDVVILDGTKVLEKNKDYTLKYQNNMNVGMATVIITGIGNYTGTLLTNFIIAPMPITTTTVHDISDQLYTGKEITPEVIISFGAVKLIEGTDYTLEYQNNINKGTATINITGTGNYSGTVTKEFNIVSTINSDLQNISKATISKIPDKTYTGSSITPDITISLNGKTLKQNSDYKVFYSDNINVGTGIATIVGTGDYTGTIETTFSIVKKNIETLSLEDIPNQEYTGKSIEPKIVLVDGSTKLKENVDYTVTYYNNVEIGLATIQIYGKGNYTGSIFKTFNIIKPTTKPPVEEEQDDSSNKDNNDNNVQSTPGDSIDNTTSGNTIPHAGRHILLFIAIISLISLSIIFYNLSKKWY